MELTAFERAVVLDANVRVLIRRGVRFGAAVCEVARENSVEVTDVLRAMVEVRRLRADGVLG